jgi:heme-degrading monooxygenase HmoA
MRAMFLRNRLRTDLHEYYSHERNLPVKALTIFWSMSMVCANEPAQEECPCIRAAKELGVKGEQLDKFVNLCGALAEELGKLDESSEIRKLQQEIDAAGNAGDEKKKKSIATEKAKLYKPPVRRFHEEVRRLFDGDLYKAFAAKLPPFYQSFPSTLRGTSMAVEYLRYRVPAEGQRDFLDGWRRALAFVGRSPHCLGYELSQSVEDPQAYVVRIDWDSVEGHEQGFKKSPDHVQAFDCVKAFSLMMCSEVHHHRILDRAN